MAQEYDVVEKVITDYSKMEDMLFRFAIANGLDELAFGWKRNIKLDPDFSTINILGELLDELKKEWFNVDLVSNLYYKCNNL